jgi:hypothetical protein
MNLGTSATRRRCYAILLVALSIALAACAAPATSDGSDLAAKGGDHAIASDGARAAAPATGAQRPTQSSDDDRPGRERPGTGGPGGSVVVDRSCSSDADCTVKNVGNCCGHYPACVNVDSPTDPEGVQAACAESGRVSTCGFPAISSCQCVQGTCKGDSRVLLD